MVHARDKARVISCGMPAFDPKSSAPRSGKSGPSLAPREPDFPQVRSPVSKYRHSPRDQPLPLRG